jgi:phosphatidylinositol alpha-1,6-mannosyltransferase
MEARMQNLLAHVDTFLTNSDFTWARFLEFNPRWTESEHRTVALGLDCPGPNVPAPTGVPAAIILGRMYRSENYKGHRELIEAWPTVLRSRNEAELWVVGGGDGADDLKGLAVKLGVERQVRFFGVVEEDEKQSLLRSARCLVLPSRGEGFGLAYLEAMRIGRPCLTGTKDAGQEVVNPPEAGLSVAPSDIPALAASVLRLLSPGPEWQDWSARAKSRYESAYTAAHFQKRLLQAVHKEDTV